jgi:hypothetical protein
MRGARAKSIAWRATVVDDGGSPAQLRALPVARALPLPLPAQALAAGRLRSPVELGSEGKPPVLDASHLAMR